MSVSLLIDANYLLFKYYYISKKNNNQLTLFFFVRTLHKLIKEFNAEYVLVAFDFCTNNFRRKLFENYKNNRKKIDFELKEQIKLAHDFCIKNKIQVSHSSEFEADDILASYALNHPSKNIIISEDKDFRQILGQNNIKVYNVFKKSFMEEDLEFPNKYYNLFLALVGDKADNIPGIAQIGPKKAVELLSFSTNPECWMKKYPQYDWSQWDLMLKLTSFEKVPIIPLEKINNINLLEEFY